MTSIHSYFYQADATMEITDSFIDNIDDVNVRLSAAANDKGNNKSSQLQTSPKDQRLSASLKSLKQSSQQVTKSVKKANNSKSRIS